MLLYASHLSAAQVLLTDRSLNGIAPTEKMLLSYESSALLIDAEELCESGTYRSCMLRRRRCSAQNKVIFLSTIPARPRCEMKRVASDAGIKPSLNELAPQEPSNTVSFYTSISGRFSSQLMDFSKKIAQSYGYVVQPYSGSTESLNQGYVLNVEARLLLPSFFDHAVGELQLISFIETAAMTQNMSTWVDGMNPSALTAAGIGVNLFYQNNHEVKIYLVHKMGNELAVSTQSSSNKIAIQALKYF
jgi:hypothetical protein